MTRTPRADTPPPEPGTALLPAHLDCLRWRYDGLVATRPAEWNEDDYRFGSFRDDTTADSPHRLCGQVGAAADLAWTLERGRSDVVVAVLDSGVMWRDAGRMRDLADQTYINRGELPTPRPEGTTGDPYDSNGDGRFTIGDYAADPRVGDRNGNGVPDPEDLILTPEFNDGVDGDGNSYVDDISGWDVQNDDNNPLDEVDYGHGSGEARDAVAAHDGRGEYGTCPGCLALHVRVADSFIAEGGRFAGGVIFSLDSGADVVLEALGAISNPPQAQAAIDAAYHRGVPIAASMADEQSQHPNLPAALNHTIPMNSITELPGLTSFAKSIGGRRDAQLLNGCTNFGGIAWVSVPSTGCSSEATGNGAGMLGVISSAARTAGVEPHPDLAARGLVGPGHNVLSANEAAQVLRAGADDIDFATPNSVDPANEFTDDFGQPRFPTAKGWDATHGYGQVNLYESVRAVLDGRIPPEADIVGPELFETVPTTGELEVRGRVAAVRSPSYSYRVEWTTGLQPGRHPQRDEWRPIVERSGLDRPVDGVLATLDLSTVAAALPGGGRGTPTDEQGRPQPDRFTARIRVVVTDERGLVGTMHRVFQVHEDPTRHTDRREPGVGTSSPVFADLDRDGADELVVAADDGVVRALRPDGSMLPGWPARTSDAPYWHPTSPTVLAERIPTPGAAISVGAPAVDDLDGDGSPEVVVTDLDGGITVIGADGSIRSRARTEPDFSRPSATDSRNRLKPGFLGGAALGDLDADGDLEIVAAAQDRHLYAVHHDGRTVDGFPVLLVDPAKIASVDPVTEQVRFADPSTTGQGGEIVATPALADLDGDGRPEVIIGAQEQYTEPAAIFPPIGSGNSRLYAVSSRGSDNPEGSDRSPGHPDDRAYLPGWPVAVPMVIQQVLPAIGQGITTQAAVGDVDGDGAVEVVTASASGQARVFERDGSSTYGAPLGLQLGLNWLDAAPPGTNSTDTEALVVAFSGPSIGQVRSTRGLDIAVPTSGARRAIDALAPNRQRDADPQVTVWSGRTGGILPGFPRVIADLPFFVTPAIADVDGDGRNEVVAGNGVQLLDAFSASGPQAPGWPKLTGGWVVGTPGFGDWDGDGTAEVATVRRDGRLLVWDTPTPADRIGDWIRFGGDTRNSGGSG
ncbi:MAG: S8 family serine peptidase [Microthrixaceae bacterium]